RRRSRSHAGGGAGTVPPGRGPRGARPAGAAAAPDAEHLRHLHARGQRRAQSVPAGALAQSDARRPLMSAYLLRRLLQGVLTFFGATFIVFAMMFSIAKDPLQALNGEKPLTETQRVQLTEQYHLDRPFLV